MTESERLRMENDKLQKQIEAQLAEINKTIQDINTDLKG